ncbi:hypothetical protein ACLMJK_002361 [Lecanora helva]
MDSPTLSISTLPTSPLTASWIGEPTPTSELDHSEADTEFEKSIIDHSWLHNPVKFSPNESLALRRASHLLCLHRDAQGYFPDPQKSDKPCLCLAWQTQLLSSAACSAAISLYQQNHPNETQPSDLWVEAQILIIERVAATQRATYNAIREKTGAIFDAVDHSDPRAPFDVYAEGHVQPWMEVKLIEAIRATILKAFVDIDMLLLNESDPSDYSLCSFDSHGFIPYIKVNGSHLPCLCKAHRVKLIAKDVIETIHFRLEAGVIPLLDEEDAMESAKLRASELVMSLAQDAMKCIVQPDDEEHRCKEGENIHMKNWMVWHIQWSCDKAEKDFPKKMKLHPNREDRFKTIQREDAADMKREVERIESLGGKDKAAEAELIDDVRGDSIRMLSCFWMPYEGCECLLWGATEIGNQAWDNAMASFYDDFPVTREWGDVMIDRICLTRERALEDIRHIVTTANPKAFPSPQRDSLGAEDHFPHWQQDLLRKRIASTVDEVKELIRANKGEAGPVAKALSKEASDAWYDYRVKRIDEEAEREGQMVRLYKESKSAMKALQKKNVPTEGGVSNCFKAKM